MLRAVALCKNFGGVQALSNFELEMGTGDSLALVGRNGSGKTTCLSLLAGVAHPTSGEVFLDGERVTAGRPWEIWRKGVCRTFQKTRTVNGMTATQYVMLGLLAPQHDSPVLSSFGTWWPWSQTRHLNAYVMRAHEVLERVGLGAALQRTVTDLTHEDRRFLELARVLAPNPRLLLLDEPAAGLTPRSIQRLGDLLDTVNAAGTGILIVDHVLELCRRVTRRVLLLSSGSTRFCGSWDAFANNTFVHADYLDEFRAA